MFHIERLVHSAGDFDPQVLVDGVFRNFHFMPLGELLENIVGYKQSLKRD